MVVETQHDGSLPDIVTPIPTGAYIGARDEPAPNTRYIHVRANDIRTSRRTATKLARIRRLTSSPTTPSALRLAATRRCSLPP
jgi:hypothetical protein